MKLRRRKARRFRSASRKTITDQVDRAQAMLSIWMPSHAILHHAKAFVQAVDSADHPLARVSMLVEGLRLELALAHRELAQKVPRESYPTKDYPGLRPE